MYPVICQIGPLTVYSYGLMLAIAVLVCTYLLCRDGKAYSLTSNDIIDLVFVTIIAGIIGARIFYVLLNLDYYISYPLETLMIYKGGLAWQGGLILGAFVGLRHVRKKGWKIALLLDLSAPYLALGHAIGRIGCFLNGCCYGKTINKFHLYSFDLHFHPTQIYESLGLFALYLYLKQVQKNKKFDGAVFVRYLVLASILRFVIEFFRGDHQITVLGLSVYQYMCLAFLASSIYVRSYFKRHSGK